MDNAADRLLVWCMGIAACAIFGWLMMEDAWPHSAPATVASQPWSYGADCCHSAADVPYGDCAPISGKYVTLKADGYHVDLPIGAHPKLKTKGYSGIIPHGQERRSQDFEYHICLSTDGGHRYCFFAAPGSS